MYLNLCVYAFALAPFDVMAFFFLVNPQIRKLRRELDASQEKVSALTTQLSANVRPQALKNMQTQTVEEHLSKLSKGLKKTLLSYIVYSFYFPKIKLNKPLYVK